MSAMAMLRQLRSGPGFALSLLAVTSHQDVTFFTDKTRSLVLVLICLASPKSRFHHRCAHPLRREQRLIDRQ